MTLLSPSESLIRFATRSLSNDCSIYACLDVLQNLAFVV